MMEPAGSRTRRAARLRRDGRSYAAPGLECRLVGDALRLAERRASGATGGHVAADGARHAVDAFVAAMLAGALTAARVALAHRQLVPVKWNLAQAKMTMMPTRMKGTEAESVWMRPEMVPSWRATSMSSTAKAKMVTARKARIFQSTAIASRCEQR